MLRIISHLERLLLQHDCVIVPKFGGFVLQQVSASYHKEEHFFRPMHKEIVFNTTLQHNDGLLSESYMKMYDVNYEKAYQMLEEDVDLMRLALHKDKKIQLGSIGSFSLGGEQQIVFQADDAELFSMESYGLSSFHFETLESVAKKEITLPVEDRKSKSDLIYIPVNRKLLRGVVAAVAAIALFLVISTPVTDVNNAAYTASFIPTDMVSVQPKAEELIAEDAVTELKEQEVAEEIKETVPPVAESVSVQPEKNQKMYYVIIASLLTDKQADDFILNVDRTKYSSVNKIERNGKTRVFIDKFDNRDRAEAYLETIRSTEKYKDAWLFISR